MWLEHQGAGSSSIVDLHAIFHPEQVMYDSWMMGDNNYLTVLHSRGKEGPGNNMEILGNE